MIIDHIDQLMARATADKRRTDSGSNTSPRNDEEFSQFKQLALSMPEIAALAITRPYRDKAFDSQAREQVQEAARHPFRREHADATDAFRQARCGEGVKGGAVGIGGEGGTVQTRAEWQG